MPYNEQYNLHSEGTVRQDTVVGSYGVGCQIEQLPMNSPTVQVSDSTVKAETMYSVMNITCIYMMVECLNIYMYKRGENIQRIP
jgi:hypothetical protein